MLQRRSDSVIWRVHEAELTTRMGAAKLAVSVHRRTTICARLGDTDAIEAPVVVSTVRFDTSKPELEFEERLYLGIRGPRATDVSP